MNHLLATGDCFRSATLNTGTTSLALLWIDIERDQLLARERRTSAIVEVRLVLVPVVAQRTQRRIVSSFA